MPVQRIRHPQLVIDDERGNCLEFALMYAGMCLTQQVAPILALVARHAFLLLVPGRFASVPAPEERAGTPADEAWPAFALDGAREHPSEPGVHYVQDPGPLLARLAAGELIAINPYGAAQGFGFEDALDQGHARVADRTLTLIDVPWLQSRPGKAPAGAPERLVTISPYLPGGEDEFISYPSRRKIEAQLRDETGVVVLTGPSGSGKSVLARHLASSAAYGTGWFLNASRPQSLLNSLAQADLARRERSTAGRQSVDREEHAQAALVRLANAPHTWTVVLDNADGDPGKLLRFVPAATSGRRQLVILTSTNPAWAEQPGVKVVALEPLTVDEAEEQLGREDLIELAEGRPLMLRAFAKLIGRGDTQELDSGLVAAAAADMEGELRAPSVLWRALRASAEIDEATGALASAMAMLPADNQPLGTLAALRPDALEIVQRLSAAGLIDFDEDGEVARMHRLFGQVVREQERQRDPETYRAQALGLAAEPEVTSLLESDGDLDTTLRLAEALTELDGQSGQASERLGVALHDVGRLLEYQGDTLASAGIYERAQRHLSDQLLIANCLQGRARAVNQQPGGEQEIQQAIDWAREAQRLIETNSNPDQAGRTVAMQGLPLQKLAPLDGHEHEKPELLARARTMIEDAHRRRLASLEPDDPELLRSEFNFGGIEINLAQVERGHAAAHLDRAEQVYTTVARRRRELYGSTSTRISRRA